MGKTWKQMVKKRDEKLARLPGRWTNIWRVWVRCGCCPLRPSAHFFCQQKRRQRCGFWGRWRTRTTPLKNRCGRGERPSSPCSRPHLTSSLRRRARKLQRCRIFWTGSSYPNLAKNGWFTTVHNNQWELSWITAAWNSVDCKVMDEKLQLEAVASGKVAVSLTEHYMRPDLSFFLEKRQFFRLF